MSDSVGKGQSGRICAMMGKTEKEGMNFMNSPIAEEKQRIQDIIGNFRMDVRPFCWCIRIAAEWMFEQGMEWEDILLTKDLYPPAAQKMRSSVRAIEKSVERTAALCWDRMTEEDRERYIGKRDSVLDSPSDLILYFAYYLHYGRGYYRHPKRSRKGYLLAEESGYPPEGERAEYPAGRI